jgi:two-component system chemotaxis response regulator CheY
MALDPPAGNLDSTPPESILIVDDSPTIRRMVNVALREVWSGQFAEANSGLEALEQLALSRVALMVLDLNMPDMHGLEVLQFVRRHPLHARLPILVLTTRGDDASREMALAAGATAYLTKPFSPQVLAQHALTLLDHGAQDRPHHVEP